MSCMLMSGHYLRMTGILTLERGHLDELTHLEPRTRKTLWTSLSYGGSPSSLVCGNKLSPTQSLCNVMILPQEASCNGILVSSRPIPTSSYCLWTQKWDPIPQYSRSTITRCVLGKDSLYTTGKVRSWSLWVGPGEQVCNQTLRVMPKNKKSH